jgi:hypothetical protein
VLITGSGCANLQSNKVRTARGSIELPQDHTFDSLIYVRSNKNEYIFVSIEGLRSKNNPAVIQSSADANDRSIRATGDVAAKVAGEVAEKILKSQGLK